MSDRPLSEQHLLHAISALCERIAVLEEGRIVRRERWERVCMDLNARNITIAALEERLRVSEAKREIERKAADDWQAVVVKLRTILTDEYGHENARLGGDDA